MSKPIFEDLFKFSGRRNRKSYILLLLLQSVVGASLYGLSLYVIDQPDTSAPIGDLSFLVSVVSALLLIVIVVSTWATGSQRLRDFGYSGWWISVTMLPLVGPFFTMWIMIQSSSVGENKYGPSCI